MNNRKHTRCSHCGWVRFNRYLEVLWRKDCRGPWHFVGGWYCNPCREGLVAFIDVFPDRAMVPDEGGVPGWAEGDAGALRLPL